MFKVNNRNTRTRCEICSLKALLRRPFELSNGLTNFTASLFLFVALIFPLKGYLGEISSQL